VIAARNLSVEEAEEILQTHDGNLREILTS
jgi:hypothetical protein